MSSLLKWFLVGVDALAQDADVPPFPEVAHNRDSMTKNDPKPPLTPPKPQPRPDSNPTPQPKPEPKPKN